MEYYCKVCKNEITSEEYDYSLRKYGKPLCRIHQQNVSQTINSNGLSKREGRYKEGMIKGRIAETLIEELFLSLGWNVFRYGMENTVPGIMKLLKGIKSEVAETIRKMPDFVIQNPRTDEVFFIEVKFRASEEYSLRNVEEDYKEYPFEMLFLLLYPKNTLNVYLIKN